MKTKGMTLQQLIERTHQIEQIGGIGKKTAKLPSYKNDMIARTKRKSEELLRVLKLIDWGSHSFK